LWQLTGKSSARERYAVWDLFKAQETDPDLNNSNNTNYCLKKKSPMTKN